MKLEKIGIERKNNMIKMNLGNKFSKSEKNGEEEDLNITIEDQNSGKDVTTKKVNQIIEKNWPKIEKLVISGLINLAENQLTNNEDLESLFEIVYETLPIAIRIAIPRKKFISFLMNQREPLLVKLNEQKKKTKDEEEKKSLN